MRACVRYSVLGSAAVLLTACATPYVPPTEPPPALWLGDYGLAPAGVVQTLAGTKHAGDVFAQAPVRFRRTGVLDEAIVTKGAFGETITIPAGSKAFATNYTLYRSTRFSGLNNAQATLDPVEWCVVVPLGFSGKGDGSSTGCFFYERPNRARLMQDYVKGGFPYSPMLQFGSAAGMPVSVPKIREQPIDLGPIFQQYRIVKLEPKGVRIGLTLFDGEHVRTLSSLYYPWNGAGEATVGGVFRLSKAAGDPTAVEVKLLGPPPKDLQPT